MGKIGSPPKLSSFTFTREDQAPPPFVDLMTYVLMSAPAVTPTGKSGNETYKLPKYGDAGFDRRLSTRSR